MAKKVLYFKELYGPLSERAQKNSLILTALSCGHPLKIIPQKPKERRKFPLWERARAGLHEGYLPKAFLSSSRPECFQDKYLRFFESLNLTVTNVYLWATLYDNYMIDTSRPTSP